MFALFSRRQFQNTAYKMAANNEISAVVDEIHSPSFSQNSCPGSGDRLLHRDKTSHCANSDDHVLREIRDHENQDGWTKSLVNFCGDNKPTRQPSSHWRIECYAQSIPPTQGLSEQEAGLQALERGIRP